MIRPISRCLNAQLIDLCQQSIKLDELNSKIKTTLETPLADNCQVAAFNKGCLILSVTNAAWATELRYLLPELRDKLRKMGLYQLVSIKIVLRSIAPQPTKNPSLAKVNLSENARDNIRNAGTLCTYEPLKEALYHLATDYENKQRS